MTLARLVPRRQTAPLTRIATVLDDARRELNPDAYLELLRQLDELARAERAHALKARPRRTALL